MLRDFFSHFHLTPANKQTSSCLFPALLPGLGVLNQALPFSPAVGANKNSLGALFPAKVSVLIPVGPGHFELFIIASLYAFPIKLMHRVFMSALFAIMNN